MVSHDKLLMGRPMIELWDVTHHMGLRFTCHPTHVNAPRLTPASKLVLDLPTPEGWKAELT